MQKRITFRTDEELDNLIDNFTNKDLFNLSALIREALKERISEMIDIDNSSQYTSLEKGETNEPNI